MPLPPLRLPLEDIRTADKRLRVLRLDVRNQDKELTPLVRCYTRTDRRKQQITLQSTTYHYYCSTLIPALG